MTVIAAPLARAAGTAGKAKAARGAAAARKSAPRARAAKKATARKPAAAPAAPTSSAPAPADTPAAPDSGGFVAGLKEGAAEGRNMAPRGGSAGSGLLLAVLLYPVALAYVRGGMPRVRMWARAKFLNETTPDATQGSSGKSGLGGAGSSGSGNSGSGSGSW